MFQELGLPVFKASTINQVCFLDLINCLPKSYMPFLNIHIYNHLKDPITTVFLKHKIVCLTQKLLQYADSAEAVPS